MWIFLNDRFVRKEDALISVFDHGFLYGDGVYETLRSYGSHIFLMREHLRRLYRSADLIGLTIPLDEGAWPPILAEAMQRNHVGQPGRDAYLRITISRGPGDIGLDPALCPMPTIVVLTKPLMRQAEHLYQTGVDLVTATIRRNHPSALPPQIKSLNFLNNILAKRDAIQAKAFDAIMLNPDGVLAECTTSNLFLVCRGRLLTPRSIAASSMGSLAISYFNWRAGTASRARRDISCPHSFERQKNVFSPIRARRSCPFDLWMAFTCLQAPPVP